ncbi:iron-containing alcohol dehydrogenase [Leadbettera azotonutricia]|uniref:NADH-dependent butanol dehydrogenase A n=1 Tax=Leadbettera azotonutricia (strain ATCC BAA-888 / DSM 13862 / ZAS-9) TaxID=545695 RepID=F5YC09_LEAAZ|nr:iron-containing alcohol dehydrogenase [Leadbettera azotonutricia]AEF82173.1 NADH-dependent butanol dehydrogenase A [Leadbettera azotonutricia ZAS-9]
MQNFEYYNRTKIIFGKGTEKQAGDETAKYAKRVLLHHSGGHAAKSGILDSVKDSLKKAGVSWVELDGVKPNPRLSKVYEGIEIVKKEKLEFILAVGGGSVIDSAKAIAIGALYDGDVWDFYDHKKTATLALPVATVLTIPAAGSESSVSSVITNEKGPWKQSVDEECIRPVFSILNPEFTYSLPPYQTACGVADMLAHIMERYFTKEPHVELTDELCEGAMRTIIRNARKVFSGGEKDYDARAEIMWAGSIAHNNLLSTGRIGDWASHVIEHELSAVYDIAHGAGLSIVFPAWIKYNLKGDVMRFARFAKKVWGVDGSFYDPEQAALEGIFRLKNFFRSIGLPVSFADAKLGTDRINEMAKRAVKFGPVGNFKKLDAGDVEAIYRIAAE